jgi:hypothetical protein
MKIIDNFIPHKKWSNIYETFLNNNFPWYYQSSQTKNDNSYMMHCFYRDNKINSDFYYLVEPILKKLKPSKILNIRANLCLKRPMICHWHVDDWTKDLNHKTAIYYVNTNNGSTVFKDRKVKSSKNKMVIFNANVTHKAEYQTDTDVRMVINFNYNL